MFYFPPHGKRSIIFYKCFYFCMFLCFIFCRMTLPIKAWTSFLIPSSVLKLLLEITYLNFSFLSYFRNKKKMFHIWRHEEISWNLSINNYPERISVEYPGHFFPCLKRPPRCRKDRFQLLLVGRIFNVQQYPSCFHMWFVSVLGTARSFL